MTEIQIIQGCKKMDRKAYKAFVDTYSKYIYAICFRYMGDTELAKDALQEALIQIINNIDKYEERGLFKSWIGSVTVKKCLDGLRKEKRHKYASMENIVEPSVDEMSSLRLEHDDVIQFIQTIPENYRIAINLFLVEGYSHKEISQKMNITESSSRSLVSRGRKMIASAFANKNSYAAPRMVSSAEQQTNSISKLKII